jgi:hypothetical protein
MSSYAWHMRTMTPKNVFDVLVMPFCPARAV